MPEKYPMRRDGSQSIDDMARQMKRTSGNKLYNEVSAELKSETLNNIIAQQQDSLARLNEGDKINRVNLKDLDAVREAADRYLEACKQASVVPGISGLSAALGYSRQWICKIANEQTEVGMFLSTLFSAFQSCLEQMSLVKLTDPATSIFIMKNNSIGMTDNHTITALPASMEPVQEWTKEQLEQWLLEDSIQNGAD